MGFSTNNNNNNGDIIIIIKVICSWDLVLE